MPAGTTLRVELLAERRGSELRADVTAEAENVRVRVWLDGVEELERHVQGAAEERRRPARRGDRGRWARPLAVESIRMAAALSAEEIAR